MTGRGRPAALTTRRALAKRRAATAGTAASTAGTAATTVTTRRSSPQVCHCCHAPGLHEVTPRRCPTRRSPTGPEMDSRYPSLNGLGFVLSNSQWARFCFLPCSSAARAVHRHGWRLWAWSHLPRMVRCQLLPSPAAGRHRRCVRRAAAVWPGRAGAARGPPTILVVVDGSTQKLAKQRHAGVKPARHRARPRDHPARA
jgi:hypothetical protein